MCSEVGLMLSLVQQSRQQYYLLLHSGLDLGPLTPQANTYVCINYIIYIIPRRPRSQPRACTGELHRRLC